MNSVVDAVVNGQKENGDYGTTQTRGEGSVFTSHLFILFSKAIFLRRFYVSIVFGQYPVHRSQSLKRKAKR